MKQTFSNCVVYILLFIFLVLIGLIIWKTNKQKLTPKQPLVIHQIVSSVTSKNANGVVAPTAGFPLDFLIEPKIEPTINHTEFSPDGRQATATREYQSAYSIYTAYKIYKDYLSVKKGWTVVETIAPNTKQQGQTELNFSAHKDSYDAIFYFKQTDSQHVFINITVKS